MSHKSWSIQADLDFCTGQTTPGATDWIRSGCCVVYVDVPIRCPMIGNATDPVIITSLGGNSTYNTWGGYAIFDPTATGFRVKIRKKQDNYALTPSQVNGWGWHINWKAGHRGSHMRRYQPDWLYAGTGALVGSICHESDCVGAPLEPLHRFTSLGGDTGHRNAHGVRSLGFLSDSNFWVRLHTPKTEAFAEDNDWHVNFELLTDCDGPIDDGNPATADYCDPYDGTIKHAPVMQGFPCDDDNACTEDDVIQLDGSCAGQGIDLTAYDDRNPCTIEVCIPETGEIQHAGIGGVPCDDELDCTIEDVCVGGNCVGIPVEIDNSDPCVVETCDPSVPGGVVTELPLGTPCDDGNACTINDQCDGAGFCDLTEPIPDPEPGDPDCTVYVCDPTTGAYPVLVDREELCADGQGECDGAGRCVLGGVDPASPDPTEVAATYSPDPMGFGTSFAESVEFLYNPDATDPPILSDDLVQTSARWEPDPNDPTVPYLEPHRIGVIQGIVFDQEGFPIPDVVVTVLHQTEAGQTQTRTDGRFDIVANGGGQVVVAFRHDDYLTAQRKVDLGWNEYAEAPKVVLVRPDVESEVDPNRDKPHIHQSTPVEDDRGTRSTLVIVPTDTTWTVNGGGEIHIRATEYTNNLAGGVDAMPAPLPTNTLYTHAIELTVDEAPEGESVEFSGSKIPIYTDNFIGFPVGWVVPVGYLDRAQGEWVPADNGVVVEIVDVDANGCALLDLDGALDEQGNPAPELPDPETGDIAFTIGTPLSELNSCASDELRHHHLRRGTLRADAGLRRRLRRAGRQPPCDRRHTLAHRSHPLLDL